MRTFQVGECVFVRVAYEEEIYAFWMDVSLTTTTQQATGGSSIFVSPIRTPSSMLAKWLWNMSGTYMVSSYVLN